jgi:hypothetical protein
MSKKREVDYSGSIADMMSGLAILFILLFIVLIVAFGKMTNGGKNFEKILVDKIKNFATNTCDKRCDLCSHVKPLEDNSIGIYFKAEANLFLVGKSDFIDEKTKTDLKCVLDDFVAKVLNEDQVLERISKIYIESKGDFYISSKQKLNDQNKYLNSGPNPIGNTVANSSEQLILTLDRSRSVVSVLFPTKIDNSKLVDFSSKLAVAGLGWGEHLKKILKEEKNQVNSFKEDKKERSVQIRLLVGSREKNE